MSEHRAYLFPGSCVITTIENGSIFANLCIFCLHKFEVYLDGDVNSLAA